jgi:glyoxylate/succinic semialdehyde reductase
MRRRGASTAARGAAVGFIGMGIMGAAMSRARARAGARVVAWDRSRDKAEATRAAFERDDAEAMRANGGAIDVVDAVADVAARCEVTFAMLADPRAALEVARAYAAASGTRDGDARTYVDCSTVDGACGEATREILGENVRFLAAPVSGGWRDAAKGELLFLGGGDARAYEDGARFMDVMGAKRWLVGDSPTHAARAKLMLQIMMGNVVGALGEMHALSERAGLDSNAILEMLSHSAMGSPLTTAKGKLMADRNFAPNFQVYLQQKDLRLALNLADELDFAAPITAATNAQYLKAKSLGHANSDFAAVAAAYTGEKPDSS